ncbi:MAG: aminotransferase class I/II-fold pyridoxal phosphate-dependent enzyme [Candidatus Thermoplasmatota archaeon]|nr:aminotransferase class I/II-fold pyridoxal phosphate-dependent enzyme [Candidatus Thermoplasmatota archaeon]
MLSFPPFRHVNWILDLPRPEYDLATSNMLPDWSAFLEPPDPLDMMRCGNPKGDPGLIRYLEEDYRVTKDRVLITNGTSEANHLAYLSLLKKGATVLIEKPIYTPLLEIPKAMGCRISFVNRRPDDYRVDLRELKQKAELGADLLVLQNHNNPSGKALQEHELRDIVKVCSDNDIPILCDEVYRDYALSPGEGERLMNPIPSIVSLYDKGIATSSVTKVYGATGLVTGWMIGAKRVVQRARSIKIMTDPMISNYGNRLALQALKARDHVLPEAFSALREKLRLVSSWARGRKDVHWSAPDACAIGFLRYDHRLSSLDFCRRLYHDHGTRAVPGAFFHAERGLRIGLTAPYEEIRGGLERIDALLDEIAHESDHM